MVPIRNQSTSIKPKAPFKALLVDAFPENEAETFVVDLEREPPVVKKLLFKCRILDDGLATGAEPVRLQFPARDEYADSKEYTPAKGGF